ncbi:MAG: phospholipase [Candidatus Dormibacteraeota bacterium]|nr:phospholipase [Candidatus Dormibacteraeota bacterium]
MSRRRFIGGGASLAAAAALAGYLPDSVLRAQAASAASNSSFDLRQVKHLVFLMQENRSFDHYFGTYPGVRGFSDPKAIKLPKGLSVFQQPDPANPDGYLEPFHMSTVTTGAAAIPDLTHNWQPQHQSWNNGLMDGWVRTHIAFDGTQNGQYTMGYHTQEDLPFHWALAEAFTLCDGYYCAALSPTNPNRAIWQNGTNDPQGVGGGPILETVTPPPLTFESGAETMFNAGISLKCYFGGGGTWKWFAKLKSQSGIPPALFNSVNSDSTTLFGNGTPGGIGDPNNPTPAANPNLAFEEDCANGVLADVSFLGTLASEHPSALPAAGAQFMAQVLDALASNQDLWNTTVLVIQYDENDGFFDHVPPPTPDKAQFPEEFVTKASAAGTPGGDLPVGLGFRVPCWVISPWSTGGQIFSEVSDHSSCLRLIESVAAAGGLSGKGPVTFPNISRWRRQVSSDFTGALTGAAKPAPSSPEFDPAKRASNLAAQQASSKLPLPAIPGADQTMPTQLKKLPS